MEWRDGAEMPRCDGETMTGFVYAPFTLFFP
jgi:hypothetical protein